MSEIKAMRARHRKEELIAVYAFIATCDYEEIATIVEEIRCVHDNLFTFNPNTKSFDKVESVCINGESIQLNIEKECEDE
jgi:hypothetical protein